MHVSNLLETEFNIGDIVFKSDEHITRHPEDGLWGIVDRKYVNGMIGILPLWAPRATNHVYSPYRVRHVSKEEVLRYLLDAIEWNEPKRVITFVNGLRHFGYNWPELDTIERSMQFDLG